ncbi:hypothetical protein [Corynebacterium variabile]|uniref:Uncharacterized protein n=1 Tax=Corynebacterium variabile TaxID=1727 RepID=A0A4Y4C7W9_9CORY|nr:hypothetical protein [Corynebacterium variabile]GEC87534.1 hypothetical protein CVA01_28480 [Corynebacterium variabile]
MTITPDQADRLIAAVDIDGVLVSAVDIAGNPVPEVTETGTGKCVADTSTPQMADLMAAAPDLAHTIAGMRWEHGVEQATGTTQWFRSRQMAEAHAQVHGCFRLVRRLVGPTEPTTQETPND